MPRDEQEPLDLTPPRMFHFVYAVVRAVLGSLFSIRWEHAARVPAEGPVVVVSNHVSMLDPLVLGIGLPWRRTIRFMAKEELFRRQPARWFIRTVSAFPVKRGAADRAAIRTALAILKAGGIVGVFPEGTRIREGEVGEVHRGAAFIASMGGATILPAGVSGTDELWPSAKRPRFAKVTVVFGEPIPATAVTDLPHDERVAALTEALMDGIAAAKAEAEVIERERGAHA